MRIQYCLIQYRGAGEFNDMTAGMVEEGWRVHSWQVTGDSYEVSTFIVMWERSFNGCTTQR